MSDFFNYLGPAADILNAGTNVWAMIENTRRNRTELELANTAVQRRVRDMQAAGINPVLAAGGGADSPAPMRAEGSQLNFDNSARALAMMSQRAEISRTNADIAKTKAEINSINTQTRAQQQDIEFAEAANPHKTTILQKEAELASATNPDRIRQEAIRTRGMNLDNQIRAEEAKLIRERISGVKIDNARQALEYQLRQQFGLSQEQARLQSARILNAGAELANSGRVHELMYARDNNLPLGSREASPRRATSDAVLDSIWRASGEARAWLYGSRR